jgi:hypothetical protein
MELWDDFLEKAFDNSNSINAIDCKFKNPNLIPLNLASEESMVD